MWEIISNFVAFLENLDFNKSYCAQKRKQFLQKLIDLQN